MTNWLVLVESNTSGTGALFVAAARRAGLRPVLVARNPARYPYAASARVDVLEADTASLPQLRAALARLGGGGGRLAGVTTSSEYFIATAAALARRFDLPGPAPAAMRLCRDKARQRRRLHAAKVPQPPFRTVRTPAAAVAASAALGYPVVVKPVDATGSIGVRRCASPREVWEHGARLLASRVNDRGLPIAPRVLVERYVDGPEYSVELFDGRVVGITRKHVSAPPHFLEIGHDFPAPLARSAARRLARCARAAAAALGADWGPAHLELRTTAHGAQVIEMNARLAGGHIPTLVRLATGVDLVQQTIARVTGQTVNLRPDRAGQASIRFLVAPGDGTLAPVNGVHAARRTACIHEVQLYVSPPAEVRTHGDFRDRIGHVIAAAASSARTAAALARALAVIDLRLASGSESQRRRA